MKCTTEGTRLHLYLAVINDYIPSNTKHIFRHLLQQTRKIWSGPKWIKVIKKVFLSWFQCQPSVTQKANKRGGGSIDRLIAKRWHDTWNMEHWLFLTLIIEDHQHKWKLYVSFHYVANQFGSVCRKLSEVLTSVKARLHWPIRCEIEHLRLSDNARKCSLHSQ